MRAALLLVVAPLLSACEACDVEALSRVPEPGEIAGRLCDPADARGILGARVWVVIEHGAADSREIDAVTDAEGRFHLEGVPVGTHDLHAARGSFRALVEAVPVEEGEVTELAEDAACIEPEVRFTVYEGHDRVEEVLGRIGYPVADPVSTSHDPGERDDDTPSWLVEQFGDLATFEDNDILFINCAAHEWALDRADPADLERAFDNLRHFIAEGGSLYVSDWAYDLLELLYPDAVDWYGDDEVRDDAERGLSQFFVGRVLDEDIKATLGRDRAALHYDSNRIAVPVALGAGARAMIEADIRVRDEDGSEHTLLDVPVLLELRPPAGPGAASPGRVIFTTFHNGAANTEAMDEVLRAIVYSL